MWNTFLEGIHLLFYRVYCQIKKMGYVDAVYDAGGS
jgi:hypothetical protein